MPVMARWVWAIARKSALTRSLSSVFDAIPISPHICVALRFSNLRARKYSISSSGENPNLVSSRATCTCISTFWIIPCAAASLSIAFSRRSESMLSISAGRRRSSCRTLLVCRCPMKCQFISAGSCGAFADSSCTRLSPKFRWPAL